MRTEKFLYTIIAFFFFSATLRANESPTQNGQNNPSHNCENHFDGKFTLVGPLLEPEHERVYQDYLDQFYKKGGIGEKIGYARPNHLATFVSSHHLALLAALGRYPVAHEIDGEALVNAYQHAGVLEFVVGGCGACMSFYRVTTTLNDNLSILRHVIGHNHYSETSEKHRAIRESYNAVAESLRLGEIMEKAEFSAPMGEVAQFYTYLQTLNYIQDFHGGSFQPPSTFAPEKAYQNGQHVAIPQWPTYAVPQAIVANLPSSYPEWKKEVAKTYELLIRQYPPTVSTKMLNEGWATLSQKLLTEVETKRPTFADRMELADLLSGVVGNKINFSQPYWFGLEFWKEKIREFALQSENQNLSNEERAKKILELAKPTIKWKNDYDAVLDIPDHFILSRQLFLYRKLEMYEPGYEWNLPNRQPNDTHQIEILSTDPAEVRKYIADNFANKMAMMPHVKLVNQNFNMPGRMHLAVELFRNWPVHLASAAQTLLVLTRITERPVVLDLPLMDFPKLKPEIFRLTVEPSGHTTVFKLNNGTLEEQPHATLTEKAQKAIRFYMESMDGLYGENVSEIDAQRYTQFSQKIVEELIPDSSMNQLSAVVPRAASAIHRYLSNARERLAMQLARYAQGQGKPRVVGSSLAFRIMPIVPSFAWDRKQIKIMNFANRFEREAIDGSSFFSSSGSIKDDRLSAVKIGSGPYKKGEKFWGGDSKGKGDGEKGEDGEDSDEEIDGDPDDSDGDPKNSGRSKPGEILVRFDQIIEIFDLELPNRKSNSASGDKALSTRKAGTTFNRTGTPDWTKMIGELYALGLKGQDPETPENSDPMEVINRGMEVLPSSRYQYKAYNNVKIPLPRALIVRILDESGSMTGDRIKVAKMFFDALGQVVRRKYKDVRFVNIGFDNQTAKEVSEEEFFKGFLSGGTDYNLGYEKALEVVKRPEFAEFDKYGIMAGDFEDFSGDRLIESLKNLQAQLNWGAAILTKAPPFYAWPIISKFAQTEQWFDAAELTGDPHQFVETFRKLFSKNRPPKGE